VNYASLARIHLTENEGYPAFAHSFGGKIRHSSQLGLARSAKAFNVANDSLSIRRGSTECLV
jgi:hypothetical protein